MARATLTYLSEADRQFIHEQTARVLAEVGIGYNTPAAIDLLAEAGAEVDRERLRAKLPWELVERCLETCPRQVRLAARVPGNDVVLGDGSLSFCTDGTGTYMFDDVTGRRTEGTAADMHHRDAPVRRAARGRLRLAGDLGPRSRSADRGPRDRGPGAGQLQQAPAGRGARSRPRAAAARHLRSGRRRLALGPADLQHHQLHDRPAHARARDDRGDHAAREGGRAGADPADAAHRHDRADDRARQLHRQHGRAAQRDRALPARAARLPAHLGHRRGGGQPALAAPTSAARPRWLS